MKKSLIAAVALLGVVFFTSNAFSWGNGGYGRGCGGGYGAKGGGPAMPNLTDEQRTQLSDLRQKFIDETYETRAAMVEKRRDMNMLLETSSPDKAKLTAMSDAILELKKQMQTKRIDYILAAKEIAPGLNMRDFRGFGQGFNKGKGFGNGPCPGFQRGGGQGAGPCNFVQPTDQ